MDTELINMPSTSGNLNNSHNFLSPTLFSRHLLILTTLNCHLLQYCKLNVSCLGYSCLFPQYTCHVLSSFIHMNTLPALLHPSFKHSSTATSSVKPHLIIRFYLLIFFYCCLRLLQHFLLVSLIWHSPCPIPIPISFQTMHIYILPIIRKKVFEFREYD